jgi:GH25 family lysozyme M1 (1,4-beta-N-acetylmuramidase)
MSPLSTVGVVAVAWACALAVPTPATASALAPVSHPERDTAGSTVAEHESEGALPPKMSGTPGVDVSHWQGAIDWKKVASTKEFAYLKATEGTDYRDPNFPDYYTDAFAAGVIRGAYHFALPNRSSGKVQADYFVSHGGAWSADGLTMPPMLDIEYNPYGPTCYGMSSADTSRWISDFSDEVYARTTRYPVIYTTANWWNQCTGNNRGFAANHPLFVARYASAVGALPSGWTSYTMWQYSSGGAVPGVNGRCDVDTFNGTPSRLVSMATDKVA